MKGMSATRPKLNLLYILENVAAGGGGGGCASQTWAPHFELSFRVMESGQESGWPRAKPANRFQILPTTKNGCQMYQNAIFLKHVVSDRYYVWKHQVSSPSALLCCSHVVAHPINLDLRLRAARSSNMLKLYDDLWFFWFLLKERWWSVEGPLEHRRRPSWGRSYRRSPSRACPPMSKSQAPRLVA